MYYGIVKEVFFWEGIRTGESEEKDPEQGREATTNSPTYDVGSGNQTWPDHIGGR